MLTQSWCCLLNFSLLFTVGPRGSLPWVLVNSLSLFLPSYRMFSSQVDKLVCSFLSVIIWDSKQFYFLRSFTIPNIFTYRNATYEYVDIGYMKLNCYSRRHRTLGTWGLLSDINGLRGSQSRESRPRVILLLGKHGNIWK